MIRTYNLSAFVSAFKKVTAKLSFIKKSRYFYYANCVSSLEFISKKRTNSDCKHPKIIKMDEQETILSSTITFVSGNSGKIAETESLLKDITTKVKFLKVDLPEYQGEADFISESKCKSAASIINGPVIIEDSSLRFNALHGLPGPYIKWFYDKLGSAGLFKLLAGYDDKSASAVCILAFCEGPGQDVKLFHGETKGSIVPPTGNCGFGWDTCFLPEGKDKTYAEISFEEKNCISHRRKALTLLKDYLSKREASFHI